MRRTGQEPGSPAGRRARGHWRSQRWRGRSIVFVLAVAMLGAACDQDRAGQRDQDLTAGKFVEVVAALREAERAVAWEDSAAALFAERKAEILARQGVTEAELRAFVAGRDASELEHLWAAIAQRLRYVPEQQGEPFQRIPGEVPDAAPDDAPDEVEVETGDDLRPEALHRQPSFPAPPVPADTGERRLH